MLRNVTNATVDGCHPRQTDASGINLQVILAEPKKPKSKTQKNHTKARRAYAECSVRQTTTPTSVKSSGMCEHLQEVNTEFS